MKDDSRHCHINWHLEEMVLMIRGKRHWLWRAVDNEGEVLDFLVQPKRNAKAALKLIRKLLKKQGWVPTRIVTDKLRSYHVAFRMLNLSAEHIDNKRANNRVENSHQPVRRREKKMLERTQAKTHLTFSAPWMTMMIDYS